MQTERAEAGPGALLAHHEQQPLCSTRAGYRQGRRLTAVKVYTVANESNHILVFGVPALKLRQETKALFAKFGKLVKFNLSPEHPSEPFAETYHAHYDNIKSARLAKRILDTKNFYGGSLHVCYAPELETVEETREKLTQRHRDVTNRLHNLKRADAEPIETKKDNVIEVDDKVIESKKLNMGEVNTITFGNKVKRKRVKEPKTNFKKKPSATDILQSKEMVSVDNKNIVDSSVVIEKGPVINKPVTRDAAVELVDCTSVDNEVITNINEHLNYNKFGNEQVRRLPARPLNRIVFSFNKKSQT